MFRVRIVVPAGDVRPRGRPRCGLRELFSPQRSPAPAFAQDAARLPVLPAPTGDPLRIDLSSDPILRLSESAIPAEEFRQIVAAAVARHPARLEAIAGGEEAEAALPRPARACSPRAT